MDKIVGTFYKGNSKRFGNRNWNTIKDDYDTNNFQNTNNNLNNIDTSKSQNIYNHNFVHQKYNHISPNLIRMQYFNNYLEQFEFRRNLHLKDYINNGIYNVYQGSSDPLMERRRDVQNKLETVKNKLLKEEAVRMERRMKKVDEENKILDDLILDREYDVDYNKNKDEMALHIMENFDDKDFEKIYDEDKKLEELKSFQSKKDNSFLILSRTHSASSSGMDLMVSSEDENDKLLNQRNRNSIMIASPEPKRGNENEQENKKFEKFGRRKSTIFNLNRRGSIKIMDNNKNNNKENNNKKKAYKNYNHTDILKILSNLDKYSVPIDNVNKELVNQSKIAPKAFQDLYDDIVELKADFKNKIDNYNNQNKNHMNILNEVLHELKIRKNFMELEADIYKPQINKIIEDAIDKYTKRRIENEFNNDLINEKEKMENDFNIRIKLTERARKANKLANNLVNEVENVNNIYIKQTAQNNDMINIIKTKSQSESISQSKKQSKTKSSINSKINIIVNNEEEKDENKNEEENEEENEDENDNNLFPALKGLNDSSSKINKNTNSKQSKTKKRRIKREVEIKDLGSIGDNEESLYKDPGYFKNERKITIREDIG